MRRRLPFLLLTIAAVMLPASAQAQQRCAARALEHAGFTELQPPLSRAITLFVSDVSLRDAIARLGSAAHVRISYSAEALPLDRRVCLAYERVPVGLALQALLQDTDVHAVVAGADHIVLSPRPASATRLPEAAPIPVHQHEPVFVSTTVPRVEHTASASMTVIEGAELVRQGMQTVAQAMNTLVPGVWVWGQSASGVLAQYASVRGASSFRGNAPKVYIDGIELANPLLLTRIPTDAIERIEVIRGPQGAALYGADAIGGVTNIITRHEVVPGGAPRLRVQSGFGLANSDYASGSAFAQDHTLSLRAGTLTRSLGVNLSLGSLGEFAPDASARHLSGDASARLLGSRTVLTATLRFLADRTAAGLNPSVPDSLAPWTRVPELSAFSLLEPQHVRQYTGGISATLQSSPRWKHTFVAGLDGYTLERDQQSFNAPQRYPSRASSESGREQVRSSGGAGAVSVPAAAAVTSSGAWRGTLRLTTSGVFELSDASHATLTLSAEHSALQQREAAAEQSRGNTGLTAQTELALHDRLLFTGGVRFEHDGAITDAVRSAALPLLGGSYLTQLGGLSVRLRAAYGKAIRWPQLSVSEHARDPLRASIYTLALAPEEQAGIEAGIDLQLGRTLSLQLTRFDQTATGLTQSVGVAPASTTGERTQVQRRYELQSVGMIDNQGWELQTSLSHGGLALSGTASLVDSRVRALSLNYTGDLRAGDRMLAVPARTASLTASWTGERTFASLTAARAADWVNYDMLALARTDPLDTPTGPELRNYWRDYGGVTHLRATLARELRRGLTFTLTGDNLLDTQLGEPDNITIVPGRTLSFGIRAAF